MGKEFLAGVSFADNAAQVAVLEVRRGGVTVVHLEEFRNGSGGALWFLESLLNKQSKIFKKVSKVSVALDCSSVLSHSFPVDAGLNRSERLEHVQWELGNFFPGADPRDQVRDIHFFEKKDSDRSLDALVISAPRRFLREIQQALGDRKFSLHLVDTNHFAGQYALAVNYPEISGSNVLLACVGEQRLDMGVVSRGELVAYRCALDPSPSGKSNLVNGFVREVPVNAVYVFGAGCTFAFTKGVQGNDTAPVTRLNPFRRVPMTAALVDAGVTRGQEHKFVGCVGIALRKE